MGIFDIFKKKNNSGWLAITNEFERIYPNQKNPKHYGSLLNCTFGAIEPSWGVSLYEDNDCYHFVSYGLSELYKKVNKNLMLSGFGREYTVRVKKDCLKNNDEIENICKWLERFAIMAYRDNEIFDEYEYLYLTNNNIGGLDHNHESQLTGFITIPDTKANTINTQNGLVKFVQFIGVTENELLAIKKQEKEKKPISIEIQKEIINNLYKKIGTDIIYFNRNSVN